MEKGIDPLFYPVSVKQYKDINNIFFIVVGIGKSEQKGKEYGIRKGEKGIAKRGYGKEIGE